MDANSTRLNDSTTETISERYSYHDYHGLEMKLTRHISLHHFYKQSFCLKTTGNSSEIKVQKMVVKRRYQCSMVVTVFITCLYFEEEIYSQ